MKQWISDYIPRKTSRDHNLRRLTWLCIAAFWLGIACILIGRGMDGGEEMKTSPGSDCAKYAPG